MPTTECPACSHPVSRSALTCPNCGHPIWAYRLNSFLAGALNSLKLRARARAFRNDLSRRANYSYITWTFCALLVAGAIASFVSEDVARIMALPSMHAVNSSWAQALDGPFGWAGSVLTYAFIPSGIILSLPLLILLGLILEPRIGHTRTAALCIIGVLVPGLLFLGLAPHSAILVGASGATMTFFAGAVAIWQRHPADITLLERSAIVIAGLIVVLFLARSSLTAGYAFWWQYLVIPLGYVLILASVKRTPPANPQIAPHPA